MEICRGWGRLSCRACWASCCDLSFDVRQELFITREAPDEYYCQGWDERLAGSGSLEEGVESSRPTRPVRF